MPRALVLCLILAACSLSACAPGGDHASRASGLSGHVTQQVVISDHPHHVLYGHVATISDQGANPVRALVISHRRDGVHRLRIYEAWQDGRALPYRRLNRQLGCSHGHCRNDAVGFIALGEGMVARAARDGFHASLIGPQGRIDIHAPARLFSAHMAPAPQ